MSQILNAFRLFISLFMLFGTGHTFFASKKGAADSFGIGTEDEGFEGDDDDGDDPADDDEKGKNKDKDDDDEPDDDGDDAGADDDKPQGMVRLGTKDFSIEDATKLVREMKEEEQFKYKGEWLKREQLAKKLKIDLDEEDEDEDAEKDKNKDKDKDKGKKDEPADDDKATIQLNDKIKITPKEFLKLSNKIKKDSGEDFEDIKKHEKLFSNLLVKYYNLSKSEAAANEKHQDNAESSKQLERERENIKSENERIQEAAKALEAAEKRLDAERKELEDLLKLDPEDEVDDKKRRELEMDQYNAKKRLTVIKTDETNKLKESRQQLEDEKYINYFEHCKTDLLMNHPGFRLSNPSLSFEIINNELTNGKFKGNEEDADKTELFTKIFTDYMTKPVEYRRNNTISEFYGRHKKLYPAIPGSESNAGVSKKDKEKGKDKDKDDNKPKKNKFAQMYDDLSKGGKQPALPNGHQTQSHVTSADGAKETKTQRKLKENARKVFSTGVQEEEV